LTRELNQKQLRALVVDDEMGIRCLIATALKKEGFTCDVAESVAEAFEYISSAQYQLVVTDLAMPDRNGHSFAVELLAMPNRPVIVVLTGVLEPRLAKDLVARGVDDVVFKPVQLPMFAAKVRSLTDLRMKEGRNSEQSSQSPINPGSSQALMGKLPRVSQDELDARLRGMPRIPSVSEAAIDVYKLTANSDVSSQQVAAAIQLEPTLIAEVLRLANSSFFNPTIKRITEVEQAVVRLGQKRVGELALTAATFTAIAKDKVPFFALGHIWRKCLAAGICLEMLVERSPAVSPAAGLFCSAVLQPMGRVLLASAFPEHYECMLKTCESERKPLSELENYVFPQNTGEVAATILASWGIPDSIHRPLRHTNLPFRAVSTIGDPLRRRVELIKTAGFLGELVASHFENWDLIDIPPVSMLSRLGVQSIEATIKQCREDLQQISSFATKGMPVESKTSAVLSPLATRSLAYKAVHCEPVDLMPFLLAACGTQVENLPDEIPDDQPVVVNALNAAAHQVIRCLREPRKNDTIILADNDNAERLRDYGRVIMLPCAYRLLLDVLGSAPIVPSTPTTTSPTQALRESAPNSTSV
jgi:HD-like signal output (HDOD) protein/ActR/RegA family two-component response regulator